MRDVLLDASHLLEAAREQILTGDQMERVIAAPGTFAGASLASLVFAVVLWRSQRCRPALVVATLHPLVLGSLFLLELPSAR